LNQMYALRYGTMPIVRNVGGLRDTIVDMGDHQGFGIRFNEATVWDVTYSVGRAIDLYYNKKAQMKEMIEFMMKIDHSWETSAKKYLELYQSLK
ncbi:MAG TPA: glycogen synthase, partial [Chitinophagaceae bacterium]